MKEIYIKHNKRQKRSIILLIILIFLVLLSIVIIEFFKYPYLETYNKHKDYQVSADSKYITVIDDEVDTFKTGVILYPGGLVDHHAYIPLAKEIAAYGHIVIIPEMPLTFAILNTNVAEDILKIYPEVDFAIGGHSLGGVSAALHLNTNDGIDKLFLLGAYPSNSLRNSDIRVVSIYGTLDTVSSIDKIKGSSSDLPRDTVFYEIEGGNHSGFGDYGLQFSDTSATITLENQLATSAEQINRLFIEKPNE